MQSLETISLSNCPPSSSLPMSESDLENIAQSTSSCHIRDPPCSPSSTKHVKSSSSPMLSSEKHSKKSSSKSKSRKSSSGEPPNILLTLLGSLSLGTDFLRSGISLPVTFHEPMTILQRAVEMFAHAPLLTQSAHMNDIVERLAYTTAYCVSGFSGTERLFSDFNPIIGETFEYIDPSTGAHILAEQVSHHPPITALYAYTSDWHVYSNTQVEAKFLGNSIDLHPQGRTYIQYPQYDESIFYSSPFVRIHNLIFGSMWLEHYGELDVRNLKSGHHAKLTFKKSGFFSGTRYDIDGYIFDASNTKLVKLHGLWNKYISATWLVGTSAHTKDYTTKLWTCPSDYFVGGRYNFTVYARDLLNCNEVHHPDLLPPTDSRLRLDRQCLFKDDIAGATRFKRILEEQQRKERKERDKLSKTWQPVFFKKMYRPEFNDDLYYYCGNYWETRQAIEELLASGKKRSTNELVYSEETLNTAADFAKLLSEEDIKKDQLDQNV